MKILLIIAGVLFFIIGNLLMNEYAAEWVSTLGMLFMCIGVFLWIAGVLMIPPM